MPGCKAVTVEMEPQTPKPEPKPKPKRNYYSKAAREKAEKERIERDAKIIPTVGSTDDWHDKRGCPLGRPAWSYHDN